MILPEQSSPSCGFTSTQGAWCPHSLLDQTSFPGGEVHLVVYLLLQGFDSDFSFATLAERAGISVAVAEASVGWLVGAGWIRKTPVPGEGFVYQVLLDGVVAK